ncbi:hypothetical protein RDSD_001056 [Oleidesulfovibrio alaskensis]
MTRFDIINRVSVVIKDVDVMRNQNSISDNNSFCRPNPGTLSNEAITANCNAPSFKKSEQFPSDNCIRPNRYS